MQKILATMTAAASLGFLAGCQTVETAPPAGPEACRDRPFDAGICEQRTNFRLFDLIAETR